MTLPPGRGTITTAPQSPRINPASGSMWMNGSSPIVLLLTEYLPRIEHSRIRRLHLTFLAASAGLTPVYDGANYPGFLAGTGGTFPGAHTAAVHADLGAVVADVRNGLLPQVEAEIGLCCMLANAGYEAFGVLDESHPKWAVPELQFLRYVRHAASHGNRWHFSKPLAPLKWRAAWCGMDLDPGALHGRQCFKGTLDSADLLRLLLDVEALLY